MSLKVKSSFMPLLYSQTCVSSYGTTVNGIHNTSCYHIQICYKEKTKLLKNGGGSKLLQGTVYIYICIYMHQND